MNFFVNPKHLTIGLFAAFLDLFVTPEGKRGLHNITRAIKCGSH